MPVASQTSAINGAVPPTDAAADESHGIFQFTNTDNEDDDWLRAMMVDANAEDVAPAKPVRHFIDRTHVMRATYDGCFHAPSLAEIPSVFATKLGPNSLISSMEHLYILGDFSGALAVAEGYLSANRQSGQKRIKETEVVEIAARCCLRLNQPTRAAEFIDAHSATSNEGGWFLLQAQVYIQCGARDVDAVRAIRKYESVRKGDPTVYALLAGVLERKGEYARAARALRVVLELYSRNARDTPIAQYHARAEIKRFQDEIERLKRLAADEAAQRQSAPNGSLPADLQLWIEGFVPVDASSQNALAEDDDGDEKYVIDE